MLVLATEQGDEGDVNAERNLLLRARVRPAGQVDRRRAVRLYEAIKAAAAELHGIDAGEIKAYVLVIVTDGGRVLESTNIINEDQMRALLAKSALNKAPMVAEVPLI